MRNIASYDDNYGNGYQITALDCSVTIEVHSDWAGSSDTGFGETCSVTFVEIQQAQEIVKLLNDWIEHQD